MSVANINGNPARFQNSRLLFDEGSGAYSNVLGAYVDGTISIKTGGREVIAYKDRGVIQAPLEGDDMPAEVEIEVLYTNQADATSFIAKLLAAGTNGLAKAHAIELEIPDARGSTNGHRHIFSAAVIDKDSIQITGGQKMDKLKFKFTNHALYTGPVRYTSPRS
ncbi:MAG TPA: hypothetical protein VK181_04290 [Rhizobium sp.]|nr:hypothetical protein [Rhizobium sp.]